MDDPKNASRGRSRRRHRDRQHEASHDAAQGPGPIPELNKVPRDNPEPLEDQADLAAVIEHIRDAGTFAYDTEFIGEETYFPQLCLIQLATSEQVFLIDPQAIEDLTPIWEIIADPSLRTLVHAGQQDLEPVFRLLGRPAQNIIDTQIAAGFAGMPYPCSLNRLVLAQTGAVLGKGMTFTRWDKRPLSSMQCRYAADDVRYLPLVWDRLREKLVAAGHLDWTREECDSLCDPSAYQTDYNSPANRLQRNRTLRPVQRAMLYRLVEARDTAAREADEPPRALMADEVMMGLLKHRPDTEEALARLPGMPRPVARRFGKQILAAIASDHIPDMPPPRPRLAEETVKQRVTIDGLWTVLMAMALGRGLAPPLLSSRNAVASWFLNQPTNESLGPPDWPGWRGEFARQALGEFLAGERTLHLDWREDRLTST